MPPYPTRLQYLFQRYIQDTATPEELREFWELFTGIDEDDSVRQDLWQLWEALDPDEKAGVKNWNETLERIHQQATEWEHRQHSLFSRLPFSRIAAAAIVMLLMGTGAYFFFSARPSKEMAKAEARRERFKNDVPPGGNKAVLTLANGTTIVLDSAKNGTLIQQGNIKILKLNNGRLAYQGQPGRKFPDRDMVYNTVTTPRGGQYQLILSDGTKVWLNAASSLRFPAAFTGKDREVALTGEAYFEVVTDKAHPFKVHVGSIEVMDLGTHFDIMAYNDEAAVKTTLLEGAVSVSAGKKDVLLKPGEQAVVAKGALNDIRVKSADTEEAVAWKNGEFSFNNTDIYSIMRQISRWYNVDVSFGDSLQVYLNGSIRKDVNVSQVFEMLELTGEAAFKIDGRKVTVLKQHAE